MKRIPSIELLEKYINGKCTDDEIALIKDWYYSLEGENDHVSDLTVFEEKLLEEQIYNRILTNITSDVTDEPQPAEEPVRRTGFKPWYAVAGIAASLLIFGGVWLAQTGRLKDNTFATTPTQELVVITNNTHQIYKSVLPDNSVVWLSPNSQIRFPKIFDKRFRGINMLGECFFEVTKNPKQPFIITSRAIVTKVWGTSFRVRDNAESNSADVSVLTGKVSVSIKGNKTVETADLVLKKGDVMLYPHQKAVYLVNQNLLKPQNGDAPAMQIWNRVNMTFDNKPLSEIVPVLNSKFHVHIKVANDKINRYILNADMSGFNLADVLEAFKKSLNVNYEIKDNVIELE
ncbi:FecR family protein [Mucilaginibacter sp. AW1-3]